MSFEQIPVADSGQQPVPTVSSPTEPTPTELTRAVNMPASLSLTTIAPPFRRPLKTFMEEARLAAAEGLKSTVSATAQALTLTLEKPMSGGGAGGDDGDTHLSGGRTVQGQPLVPGLPAPKPWR